jgi:hypothetical protein
MLNEDIAHLVWQFSDTKTKRVLIATCKLFVIIAIRTRYVFSQSMLWAKPRVLVLDCLPSEDFTFVEELILTAQFNSRLDGYFPFLKSICFERDHKIPIDSDFYKWVESGFDCDCPGCLRELNTLLDDDENVAKLIKEYQSEFTHKYSYPIDKSKMPALITISGDRALNKNQEG